jgi:hypothetical protein
MSEITDTTKPENISNEIEEVNITVPSSRTEFEESYFDEEEESLDISKIRDAVVFSTDWTVEVILNQISKENLNLKPRFQRREAWDPKRQSKYIESLMLGFPVPQLVLAETENRSGKYIVLDGKQRLITLTKFVLNNPSLKLKDLELEPALNGKTFNDLQKEKNSYLEGFMNAPIRTVIIRAWTNKAFLHNVFIRLNTGSLSLSPQELRQALFTGAFTQAVDDYSAQSPGLHKLLGSKSGDFRMRDAELLIRYLSFRHFIHLYEGNLKKFLDETCEKLNKGWAQDQANIRKDFASFEQAIDLGFQIFGDNFGEKWAPDTATGTFRYEGRLNKAVLDIMLHSLSETKAPLTDTQILNVENQFKQLCQEQGQFFNALTTTTKSYEAVKTRFNVWQQALSTTLNAPAPKPLLK